MSKKSKEHCDCGDCDCDSCMNCVCQKNPKKAKFKKMAVEVIEVCVKCGNWKDA